MSRRFAGSFRALGSLDLLMQVHTRRLVLALSAFGWLGACSATDAPAQAVGGAAPDAGGPSSSAAASSPTAGTNGATIGGSGGAPTSGNAGAPVAASAGAPAAGSSGSGAAGSPSGGSGGEATAAAAGAGGEAADADPDRCRLTSYDAQQPPRLLTLAGDLGTHDPMLLSADGRYYLFSTGANIGAKSSNDLLTWRNEPDVLSASTRPAWIKERVPDASNLWAPDASYFGGAYHLYYAASSFGSNRSCIGHLSRPSLAAGSWKDQGPVFCSNVDSKDNFNAIDPNVLVDTDGTPWLSFGSFWSGIKLIKLDQAGARDGSSLDALAARPDAGGALEAPFLVRRCGYYYLFTSWDKCCQGADSTYNIRVGRSSTPRGPFVDHTGKSLLEGGGTLVLKGGTRYRGPGHNAVLFTAAGAYNVYHAYDADHAGDSVLRIAELVWDSDGWPISAGP
jgi:arabinan endo-1,5-alpha-L-arabinosidase